jgi:hypothetical protein
LIENNLNSTKNLEEVEPNVSRNNLYLYNKILKTTADGEKNSNEKIGLNKTKDLYKENIIQRNSIFPNYMKSCDSLSKKRNLIKCKSTNLFKNTQNQTTESSNKYENNNKDNHPINY